jgi:hypothetical protein
MQKKQIRMRFLITALIPILASVLMSACDSPAAPKPVPPGEQTPPHFGVIYFGNGNTAGEAPKDTNEYGDGKGPVAVMGRGTLYRVGYRFAGWNTKADGSGTTYAKDAKSTR